MVDTFLYSFQGEICTMKAYLGHFKVSLVQGCPLGGVPLYSQSMHQEKKGIRFSRNAHCVELFTDGAL